MDEEFVKTDKINVDNDCVIYINRPSPESIAELRDRMTQLYESVVIPKPFFGKQCDERKARYEAFKEYFEHTFGLVKSKP